MPLLSRLAVQAARAYGMLVSGSANNVPASYLAVAGGGGGGSYAGGGGGGAGGYQTSTFTLSILNTYSITVGAGGVGGVNATPIATNGSNSVISGTGLTTITSTGGGRGGGFYGSFNTGNSGGSGGGNAYNTTATGGAGTSGQGNNGGGGSGGGLTHNGAGGGGGASAVGGNSNTSSGAPSGNGGAGTASSISGSSVTYAGGGGGGNFTSTAGTGGSGGGGNGGSNASGTAGTVNLGGGGGGSGSTGGAGGAGGSGIVIISYTSATPKFVGGTLTTSGGNQIHTFTSSGTLSPITPITASYLVVAGGGSGSTSVGYTEASGGGGAGGLLSGSTTIYSGATYVVTVGAGGAGSGSYAGGNNGSNSVLSGTGITTITSTGGGRGNADGPGENGGSGGAGGAAVTSRAGGTGISGQGNNGGSGFGSATTSVRSGGGGGGSGAAGANATSGQGGAGGAGTASSITGTSVTYAAGGGGSSQTAGASGGSSVGGNGQGLSPATSTTSGIVNTGSGGGAAINTNGGSGGSGIVIISYAGSQVFNGGLVTSSGGNTIHTFTSTGALTPLTNNLTNSLRFRSSASAYLNRTPTLAGSRTTWTWSAWVKRGTLGSAAQAMLGAGTSTTIYDRISFENDQLRIVLNNGTGDINTTQVFRDPSAWYHLVVAMDTTQATAANRTRIYVNGNQVTAFATATYPSLNYTTNINNNIANSIGALFVGSWGTYFDGYMDDIYFIDGQALEPYFFGNNDANGVWKPIQYRGTYGTNGFYLNFSNTTSTTTLGFDSSPNGNNWTTNNISLTAGTTYDAMTDVPTNTSATTANYAVMNPVGVIRTTSGALATFAGGNLNVSGAANWFYAYSSIAIPIGSGKYYSEFTINTSGGSDYIAVGINPVVGSFGATAHSSSEGGVWYSNNATRWLGSSNASYGASYTAGDIIGVAVDSDASTITFYKNNTSQGSISFNSNLTSNNSALLGVDMYNSSISANFGQRPFSYTPPTGFVALNTFNLPTPTILQGNKYMDATLYSGNNVGQVVVNQGQFRPDFLWIKVRTNTYDHTLADSVRGVSAFLASNTTAAEGTNSELTSFNTNGFTLGATGSMARNVSGQNYVAWQWQAGQGTNTTNTSGSITSTVSVNTTAGFSIVTYTGNGTNGATIGHGLGVAPRWVIVKRRNSSGDDWLHYHISLGATQSIAFDTGAAITSSTRWNNTTPSSTVITLGTSTGVNASGGTYVAYCWAEIAGFSRFGSYTGNGSADGPFIFTGFRPKFIMRKQTTNNGDVGGWIMFDTSRDTFNVATRRLLANSSNAEATPGNNIDILSNGWKERNSDGYSNASGQTYIYMAFAENPFKNALAR